MIHTHYTVYCSYQGMFPNKIVNDALAFFPGATTVHSLGQWQGVLEASFQIHLILHGLPDWDRTEVFELANTLRTKLKQSEVWIESYETIVSKVTA